LVLTVGDIADGAFAVASRLITELKKPSRRCLPCGNEESRRN
jgi:hypothetical protein